MKDQYVGDISDFEKYAILRALAFEAHLPLAICWMFTAADETGEGARIDYLKKPERYRDLDAHVFDRLSAIVASGSRNVAAIERAAYSTGPSFSPGRLRTRQASDPPTFRKSGRRSKNGRWSSSTQTSGSPAQQ